MIARAMAAVAALNRTPEGKVERRAAREAELAARIAALAAKRYGVIYPRPAMSVRTLQPRPDQPYYKMLQRSIGSEGLQYEK